MIRRIVMVIKNGILVMPVGLPIIFSQLVYCSVIWIVNGQDVFLENNTPMGWLSTGWRERAIKWPTK